NSYDLATCIRLFHHLDTYARERVLRELARVSRAFVLVNVSLSSPFYRCRRGLKRCLKQGVSSTSSTWDDIRREADASCLPPLSLRVVMRYLSEDLRGGLRMKASSLTQAGRLWLGGCRGWGRTCGDAAAPPNYGRLVARVGSRGGRLELSEAEVVVS